METKQVRLTKKHYACYAILSSGRPLTRLETMALTHAIQRAAGCELVPFCPTSNVSYWLPRTSPFCSASRSSFIVQGVITKVGKRGRAHLYDLTPLGRELAEQAQAHLIKATCLDWHTHETTGEDYCAL